MPRSGTTSRRGAIVEEGVAPTMLLAQDGSRHREHRAAEFSGDPGRDQRAASLTRLDHDNGITPAYQQIQLIGSNIEFTGNTVHYHGARSPVIALAAATADCTVTGNTINKAAGTTAITDAGSGNTITPNTVVDG